MKTGHLCPENGRAGLGPVAGLDSEIVKIMIVEWLKPFKIGGTFR
jgi:hypothetical protein